VTGPSTDEHGQLTTPSRLALDDLLAELLRRTREAVDVRDGLWKLIEAVVSVASAELSLASVLDRIVAVARDMVDAEYAALGVLSDTGGWQELVHVGVDADTVARIGHLPGGHGILGLLINEPQVLRLDDLSEHPAAVGFPEHHPPMGSFLGVPIKVHGKIYGNLYLTNRRDRPGFTDDDVELTKTLAAAAGVAIDNARLHDEALRRGRWQQATGDVIGEMLRGGGTTHVLALLVARGRELADAATSTLVLAADDELVVAAADGLHAGELLDQRFGPDGSISGAVLATGRAIALDDVTDDQRTDQPMVDAGGLGPAMFLPLVARDRRLGTLVIAREKGQQPFGNDDLRLAESFAAQAALVLDYGDAQAERRRVAVFNERERIARDMHDLVIQRLFAAGLALQAASCHVTDATVTQRLDDAVNQIDAAIGDLRSSIFGLHGRRGEAASLTRQIEEICVMAEITLGFAPECHIDPTVDAFVSDELTPDLLAVLREALTNVSRHADATEAAVRLEVDDGMINLEVTDNGLGATGWHGCIASMRSRAERLDGTLNIAQLASGGTHFVWRVPIA
jgi:signal transduction histidine kinase